MARAWLVDVYDTMLTVPFGDLWREAAAPTSLRADELAAAAEVHVRDVMTGRMRYVDAIADALSTLGSDVDPSRLAGELAAAMSGRAVVFADVVPWLDERRRAGDAIAFVSNCGDDTRGLLGDLGLAERADVLVLSCEIGSAKPDPAIYLHALEQLGVDAAATTLVDDQPSYCEGARRLGIDTVRIDRRNVTGAISSFDEIVVA